MWSNAGVFLVLIASLRALTFSLFAILIVKTDLGVSRRTKQLSSSCDSETTFTGVAIEVVNDYDIRKLFSLTSRRSSYYNVHVPGLRWVREEIRQALHRRQTFIIELEATEGRGEVFVNGKGNLPENELIGVDVLESMSLFGLDSFPEGVDSLAFLNLDLEDVVGVITLHQTVEI